MTFPELADKHHAIKDIIVTLEAVNYQIAELKRIKEAQEDKLKTLFNHTKEGQETYVFERYKVEISTGYNYRLNIKKYLEFRELLDPKFDPVKEVVKYELNKKLIKDCEEYGTFDDKDALSAFVEKNDKKLSVKIRPGC
jgi:hypothetical protein